MDATRVAAVAAVLLASWALPAASAPRTCALSDLDEAGVSRTIHALFAALAKDDEAGFGAVTSTDFYAYEGKRVSGPELSAMIRKAHAAGRIYEWNLGPIDIHGGCNVAWATWENHGQVGDATAMKPVTWLESGALRRDGSRWVVDFLHSTRVAPAQ